MAPIAPYFILVPRMAIPLSRCEIPGRHDRVTPLTGLPHGRTKFL
jgi:hypothetical protein